jgi:hypothetical protein
VLEPVERHLADLLGATVVTRVAGLPPASAVLDSQTALAG